MLDKNPPTDQDYVVVGKQPWLDGVMTQEGVVRQVCFQLKFCLVS